MLRVLKLIPLVVVAMIQVGCNKDSNKAAPIVAAPLNAAGLNIKNECPAIRQNLESNRYSVSPGVYLTPLMKAAFAGNAFKVRSLLMHDKNIDLKDRYGRTALQYAILGGNYDTFLILFRAGANINLQNSFKASSAHLAAVWNRTEMVKQMVNSVRLEVNTTSKFQGLTMLHSAAANCNLDLIQFLIQHGADVNKKSADMKKNELIVSGRTPLKEAMALGAAESIDLLLQLGADPSL